MELQVLKYEPNVELVNILGYKNQVSEISINGFRLGNPNENLTVEISFDNCLLTVYNEDESTLMGRVPIAQIEHISFVMCEELFILRQ